ncbi:VOC family protein [Asaia astilbis]|uniref:VOC family protein n=1 Tax=Asaia astilbis TaxID=610244 RepID=UPI0004721C79|nr:VOC family protein [Asaia astilbis]
MALTGIDAITFGVHDMEAAYRFLIDWGLTERLKTPERLEFTTQDGGEVIVRPHDAPDLPPAIEEGNTVRQIVWGVASESALEELVSRIASHPEYEAAEPGGTPRLRDPNGLGLAFRVKRRQPVKGNPTLPNAPGVTHRLDQRSPVYTQAKPLQIGHVVLFTADYAAMRAFYLDVLGFIVSDEYPGHGCFMRCAQRGGHHNQFILNRPGRPGVNHVAFTLNDVHEVIGGGLAMSRKGWKTEIGPGRHPISSAYFWYFENPLAAPLEYYADEDYCTEAWEPQTFERRPELFAEWAIAGGIDGTTRRQVIKGGESDRGHN